MTGGGEGEDDRTLRRWGPFPAAVVAAALALAALGATWSVVMPLAEAPDEHFHLGLVLHLADGGDYPRYDGLDRQVSVHRLCQVHATSPRLCRTPAEEAADSFALRRHPADAAPARDERPTWREDGGRETTGLTNQMPQHPPLYYQGMAGVLRGERAVTGGTWGLDQELALLRLVNALLIAPLPLLAWWACRRSGLADRVGVTAAVILLGLPMLTHIGSTLNNDNLLTLLGGVLVALLAGVARGDRSRRTALLVGLVVGAALLTKASAVVFPPAVLLAYVVGLRTIRPRDGRPVASVVRPLATSGVAAGALAAWWYVGVWARTGRLTPTTEDARLDALRPAGFHPGLGGYAAEFSRLLGQRFWGSFGWYTVQIGPQAVAGATVLVGAALVAALWPAVAPAPGTTVSRRQALVLAAPGLGLLTFVALHAYDLHARSGTYPFIQGRYLFPGLVGFAVLVAVGLGRAGGRWAPVMALVAGAALQVVGIRRCLIVLWGGPGVTPVGRLRAMSAWSGWPAGIPLLLVGATGIVVVGLGGLVAEVVRAPGRPADGAAPTDRPPADASMGSEA